ncbi:MAG: HD domain-containing protein [Patescibacteria group bacterium]
MSSETVATGRERFLAKLAPYMLADELENVLAAYELAKYGHRGQKRDSGERYFEHPRAVAEIIIDELELRNDWRIVATALLHDVLEDAWILSERRLALNFGRDVALWLRLLTKKPKDGYLERLREHGSWEVLVVKLCDRLHNLRSLGKCDEAKQRKQIVETRAHYVPLAELLIERLPLQDRTRGAYLRESLTERCVAYEALLGIPAAE